MPWIERQECKIFLRMYQNWCSSSGQNESESLVSQAALYGLRRTRRTTAMRLGYSLSLRLCRLRPLGSLEAAAAPWLCSTSFSLHCRRLEASVVEAPMLLSNVVCTTRTWSTTKPSPGCNISPIASASERRLLTTTEGQLLWRDPP